MKEIRILLADDHNVMRAGLKLLLEKQPGFKVVSEASDGHQAIENALATRPDVVVLPKVESAKDVSAAAELLPAGIGLEAQVETALGLANADAIAAAGHGLEALVFGPADLAASLGIPVLTIG